MIDALVEYLKNKKILILGFGIEGYSTYNFIRKYIKKQKIYISDVKPETIEKYKDVIEDTNVEILGKDRYFKELEDYDIIMKSPGISFANMDTTKFFHKIKSQLELFLEFIDVFTIGVTGTKGKSTTSSLIYEIISKQRRDVHLLGNIGVPLFDEIDKLTKKSVVVLELSSHQLEYVEVSPNISIILNIFEEHLDHYKSYEHYINAKLNICRYQKENDYFIYNIDNKILSEHVLKMCDLKPSIYQISMQQKEENNNVGATTCCVQSKENNKAQIPRLITKQGNTVTTETGKLLYSDSENRQILGDHNFNNIMFAITVAKIMNLDLKIANETIYKFEPLPHRMEFVGEFDGVKYYNDSIATVPASTINGVQTLKEVNTLIIGGKDRGIDYTEFADFLGKTNIEHLICLPDTGWKIADMVVNENMEKYIVKDMQMAVSFARKLTKKGSVCLLSPAASSYGFFKNFKERGELFKRLVKEDGSNKKIN